MIILVMGLPGSGKTTLSRELAAELGAVHWNADEVRGAFGTAGKFSILDRIEQAKRMRFLCDIVNRTAGYVIADFVCPTNETREAFGDAFTIYVDRIDPEDSTYMNTRDLFVPPTKYNLRYDVTSTRHDALSVITNHQGSWT